jgi:hypothetical protein
MNILDIGKFLYRLFKIDLKINIYPLVAENSAVEDYAVYQRIDTVHLHKDQQLTEATYNIAIVASQYDKSIEMLQRVIDVCRKTYGMVGTDALIRLEVVQTQESYNDAYIQSITIKIKI